MLNITITSIKTEYVSEPPQNLINLIGSLMAWKSFEPHFRTTICYSQKASWGEHNIEVCNCGETEQESIDNAKASIISDVTIELEAQIEKIYAAEGSGTLDIA